MGVALAGVGGEDLDAAAARLIATRPTAANLTWGVARARAAADPVTEAVGLAVEEVDRCRRIGANGAELVPEDGRVLTHCNTGALACVGYGTALGVVRAAHDAGRRPSVWVGETRPVLQGARLTAWELDRLGIPFRIVPDALAGALMREGEVDCIIVGADRIAANGDVANKVGTYSLAVLAEFHAIPFYVAAPISTFDPTTRDGAGIPIERRSADEILVIAGHRIAPVGANAENRAFDVTPARLITAYVTEEGVQDRPGSLAYPSLG